MTEQSTKLSGCLTRIGAVYTSIAIMLLTTVIFLIGFEITVITYRGIRSVITPDECTDFHSCPDNLLNLPYYRDKEWAVEFWTTPIPDAQFHPYSLWHTEPNSGKYINFDEDGFRITPNVQCDDGAYHIYMFGGSTTWGDGAPDWGTVPAYLQGLFNETDRKVCMHNMGQRAFNSTQEVVELVNQLQLGIRPDMVIFYDGVNETGNMIEAGGKPWYPSSIIRRLLWEDVAPIVKVISSTNTYSFLSKYFKSPNADPHPTFFTEEETKQLIQETVNVYLSNYQIVNALSEHFEFEFYYIWQPTIVYQKPLSEDEEIITDLYVPRIGPVKFKDNKEVILAVYHKIEELADDYDRLYYIGDLFSDHSEQLYIDLWHITPDGNEIVAQKIFDILDPIP